MHRQIASSFVFLGFALALVACKTPGPNDAANHEEQASPKAYPQAQEPREEEPPRIVEDEAPFDNDPSCPPPEEPEGICIQMIAFAKHPDTGVCCQYPTPCHAPQGWETYPTLEECEGA